MADDNASQIRDWDGVVGERWAAEQETTDERIRPFGLAAMTAAAPQPGERVLDVGCGCGDTSLALAQAVGPMGAVVGVDVSSPMLAVARRRAGNAANLSFIRADASHTDLPGPFDLLYSRFGVMFFDDPPAAFLRMRQAMKPTGRLAFACWQSAGANPWAAVPAVAARQAAGLDAAAADPFAPGPFAFGEASRVSSILEKAGFVGVQTKGFEAPMYLGSSPRSAAEGATRIGPASRVLREAGEAVLPVVTDAIEKALRPYMATDGTVAFPGRVWIVTAQAA